MSSNSPRPHSEQPPNGHELAPAAMYGIVVTVTRHADDSADAEVTMVYGPLAPPDVANLLRLAATKLEREAARAQIIVPKLELN